MLTVEMTVSALLIAKCLIIAGPIMVHRVLYGCMALHMLLEADFICCAACCSASPMGQSRSHQPACSATVTPLSVSFKLPTANSYAKCNVHHGLKCSSIPAAAVSAAVPQQLESRSTVCGGLLDVCPCFRICHPHCMNRPPCCGLLVIV